jgi:hypothetical protein
MMTQPIPTLSFVLAIVVTGLLPRTVAAAPSAADPDWPCPQPLVPTISAELVWSGPPINDAGEWRSEPAVAALVATLTPREISIDDGKAAISRFLRTRHANRTRSIKRAVAGLLDEANNARSRVIAQIKMLAERQRGLANIVSQLTAERDKAGKDASADLTERWTFTERTYYEMQRTMRYACEIPAELDQRLGAYVNTLQAGLR